MPEVIELKKRESSGTTKARALRREEFVPGVIYGDHIDNRLFCIEARLVPKFKKAASITGLIDIKIEGDKEPVKAIIQKIDLEPVKGTPEHIDLYQVRMDQKLHTEAILEFIGVSSAVRDFGGILVKQHGRLPIECLPKNIIHHLEVPIDSLKTFQDVIRIKDINLPEGVLTHLDPEEIIASISEPRSEKELEELSGEVKADVSAVEVTGEKKPEEGAEAAASQSEEPKK